MAQAASFISRNFTKKGRTRHARQQMVSNRNAQSQSLFGADRKTTDLWNQKSRSMSQDEAMNAFDLSKQRGKEVGSRRTEVEQSLTNGGLGRTQRNQLQQELTGLKSAGSQITKERNVARDVMDGTKSHQVGLSGMEQTMNKGKAAANYMWGGTGKQIAARNGAAAAGIIGVGVGMDALDGSLSD